MADTDAARLVDVQEGLKAVAADSNTRAKKSELAAAVSPLASKDGSNVEADAFRGAIGAASATPLPVQEGGDPTGATDSTAAFVSLEAMNTPTIDLAGGTYAVTPFSEDTANGIFLTKDYGDGQLVVGGVPLVFDNREGLSRSSASAPLLIEPNTTRSLGLNRLDANNYHVWRSLGGRYWARYLLNRSGSGLPFNWNETYLMQALAFKTAEEAGVTYNGTNSQLTSASATLYVNGRARRLDAVGAYVEVTFTGGGDLYAVFFGREDSNYINVTLDGGSDYLTLADDGAGNRYFDAYANPIEAKKTVLIASGVPEGAHTVRFTLSATKNPSNISGTNRFWFNAVAWDGPLVGPWVPAAKAKPWAAGQAVLQNEERFSNGKWYIAAAAGTTGTTAPSHASGSVSDGGVSWAYRTTIQSSSSYALPDHRIQGTGSQLEYAYQIQPAGTTIKEDVGGFAHGNETQTDFTFRVSGSVVSLVDGGWAIGDSVDIQEHISATHSQIGGGVTPVVSTVLRRSFGRRWVEISHDHNLLTDALVGWFYAHMWPLLHYNAGSAGYKTGITEIWSPCDETRYCADYYYDPITPPYQDDSVAITKDYLMIARGDAYLPMGTLGAMSAGDSGLKFHAWLQVAPEAVDNYRGGSRTFASKSMNMSNKNPLTEPASSMICKMYFMRHDGNAPASLIQGAVISCRARYGLALTAS